MKRYNVLKWICLLLGLLIFKACDDNDDTWVHDFWPFSITFLVEDQAGNDLLAPDAENGTAENGIYAIFQGKIYQKDSLLEPPGTKAVYVPFEGLNVYYAERFKRYALDFGPFLGDDVYNNEMVIFDWGDGSKRDTVTFSNDYWINGPDAGVERSFYFNGKKTDMPIKIIRE